MRWMVASKIKTGSVPMDNELAKTEEGRGGQSGISGLGLFVKKLDI